MDKKAIARGWNSTGLSIFRGVGGFKLPGWAEEIGGDTVGRLGMCVHCQKRNKNNAQGVTPIYIENKRGRRMGLPR
jgi:hypothetical protein